MGNEQCFSICVGGGPKLGGPDIAPHLRTTPSKLQTGCQEPRSYARHLMPTLQWGLQADTTPPDDEHSPQQVSRRPPLRTQGRAEHLLLRIVAPRVAESRHQSTPTGRSPYSARVFRIVPHDRTTSWARDPSAQQPAALAAKNPTGNQLCSGSVRHRGGMMQTTRR